MGIISSARGNYLPLGNPDDADVIIGHSFGILTDEKSVNRKLADYITAIAADKPVIADRNLADSFGLGDVAVAHVVEGPVSDTLGNGVGTWGTLVEAKEYMEQEGLELALMVGQAHHIGRIAMQASKLDIPYVLPVNLPRDFETHFTKQWWTRSAGLWFPRETVGSLALKRAGRL